MRRRRACARRSSRRTVRSEEHTSELQSHGTISYAVFCLKKKTTRTPIARLALPIRAPDFAGACERVDVMSRTLFFFNDTATTEIYTVPYTLSLHDALPI